MPRTVHCGIELSSCGMRPDVHQRASGPVKAMLWRGGPTVAQFFVTRSPLTVENFREPLRNACCMQGWASMSLKTYPRRPNWLNASGGNARPRRTSASRGGSRQDHVTANAVIVSAIRSGRSRVTRCPRLTDSTSAKARQLWLAQDIAQADFVLMAELYRMQSSRHLALSSLAEFR